MPQAIPAVIGLVGSVAASRSAAKSASKDRGLSQAAIDRLAQVDFDPENVMGPGGVGFDFDLMQGNLGDFAPFLDAFGGLADINLGQGFDIQQGALQQGMPMLQSLMGSAGGLSDLALDSFGMANTDMLQNLFGTGSQFALENLGNATAEGADLRQMGADFGLSNAMNAIGQGQDFFGRSNFFADEAQQGFEGLRADTLNLLRERDREGEDRAAAGLADTLFGTGRLGIRSGGEDGELVQREISDFGRGLANADLDRQLAATQEARASQMQSGNLAQMFGNMGVGATGLAPALFGAGTGMVNAGTGVSGLDATMMQGLSQFGQNFGYAQELENSLLNSAFDRFGSTAGLVGDLFGDMYNTGGTQIGQAGDALASALGLSQLPLNFGEFAANLAANEANTEVSAAGGQVAGAQGIGPSGRDIWGAALGNMGSNLFNSSGGWNAIADIFRKSPPAASGGSGGSASPKGGAPSNGGVS